MITAAGSKFLGYKFTPEILAVRYTSLMDHPHPRIGVGVFVFKNGRFLMGCRRGSHGSGSWSVPGGHLEFGETIETAAKREVKEETNLEISRLKIAGVTNDIFESEGKHYLTIWVTSFWQSGTPRIMEPDKFIDLDWYNFDTLSSNLFLPWRQLFESDFLLTIKNLLAS
ncbi:NUDIX hydrolase [Patescibacteria group bacterium]|nr:NUDIX hydrolase [Patescibacteria group bacterium]